MTRVYHYAHNPHLSLAVWYFDRMELDEWELHFEHLRDLATWSGKTGKRAAVLLMMGSFELPLAEVRQMLTQLTNAPGYDPHVAFVTPTKAAQTVLTLFSWFQKKPQYETRYVANPQEGVDWLEQRRGTVLPELRTMLTGVLRALPQLAAKSQDPR